MGDQDTEPAAEQLALLPAPARAQAQARKSRQRGQPEKRPAALAETAPVARVLVDVPLAHLDRPFDYAVPATMAEDAVPGARVKVRFAGQDVDGFVLERTDASGHQGRLLPLRRVVSAEPVLQPEVAALTGQVARRCAGTRSDVLRLAVPPRHAATEKRPSEPAGPVTGSPDPSVWAAYSGGPEMLAALHDGIPRTVCSVLPGDDWTAMLAEAVLATASGGRGALVCVPDHRDVDRLDAALARRLGEGRHVVLTAEAGPSKRYAAFLAAARGAVRIVIGTRAAAFAPVTDLGLVAVWDDGDDLFAEPRAPYPHTREVLLMRAGESGCAALLAGHARSCEAQYLLRTGWATEVAAPRATVRERVSATVSGASDLELERDPHLRTTRLPHEAFEAIRSALVAGPVLLQTPRAGYATRLACDRCRTPALCDRCHGPLRIAGPGRPAGCRWCGTVASGWQCGTCGDRGLRAPVLGDQRTAEEIGRAFPNVPVRTSSGERVLAEVPDTPAIVVATPGAEPTTAAGYSAVLLLDTWLLLARSDLRASEEALRRWSNAVALVRPVGQGGRVLAVGRPDEAALQALVRWDPAGFAEREIAERASAHLPPASRMATVSALPEDAEQFLDALAMPAGGEVLGPVPADDDEVRFVVRVPRRSGAALSTALAEVQAQRSARKLAHVRVQVDPHELG